MSLEVVQRHQDPVTQVLHRFDLPSDNDRLGIRLYDADVSLEEAALGEGSFIVTDIFFTIMMGKNCLARVAESSSHEVNSY